MAPGGAACPGDRGAHLRGVRGGRLHEPRLPALRHHQLPGVRRDVGRVRLDQRGDRRDRRPDPDLPGRPGVHAVLGEQRRLDRGRRPALPLGPEGPLRRVVRQRRPHVVDHGRLRCDREGLAGAGKPDRHHRRLTRRPRAVERSGPDHDPARQQEGREPQRRLVPAHARPALHLVHPVGLSRQGPDPRSRGRLRRARRLLQRRTADPQPASRPDELPEVHEQLPGVPGRLPRRLDLPRRHLLRRTRPRRRAPAGPGHPGSHRASPRSTRCRRGPTW